jgi:hypothetical protein
MSTSEKLSKLLSVAQAKKAGLTCRVTRPAPAKFAHDEFGSVLTDFRRSLRKAAVVLVKGTPKSGMAEVWAEKAPKLDRVSCLEFQDLGCGPPSQWSKNGRPKPLRKP